MSLKIVIQDYKRDHELTYRNLAERTTVSKRTLEAYGNGEKEQSITRLQRNYAEG
ncbi:hypothetical protein [Staphylococcus equorum]|uniref:hypothetical protein n=1 Tax=Staphylococcus equorum TaxID=246432 RepID=UPI003EBCAABA